MDHIMNSLYDVNFISVTIRLCLAVILGGIIGLERGSHKHAAGFRTHILVCVGATLAMLTNQYIFQDITSTSDPSRIGAQVITGVGFLGVGTILVTGNQKIKGLTTAAGLWASACTGLAIGIGFYQGALIAGLLIIISLSLLPKVEELFYNRSRTMDLYIELDALTAVKEFITFVESQNIVIYETHFNKSQVTVSGGVGFHITIKRPKKVKHAEVINMLHGKEGVAIIEEL